MIIISKPSPDNDYFKIKTVKKMIVLHYTGGGTLYGAEAALRKPDYVNVHFGIDDDGKVYQYFDESYWAYHTGTGKQDAQDSIGIEIRSWGHLTRTDNILTSWTGKQIPWGKVVKCRKFRGFNYWEALTEKQIDSVKQLVLELCGRHPITRVVTHAMLNKSKLDFPPDYPGIKDLIFQKSNKPNK